MNLVLFMLILALVFALVVWIELLPVFCSIAEWIDAKADLLRAEAMQKEILSSIIEAHGDEFQVKTEITEFKETNNHDD